MAQPAQVFTPGAPDGEYVVIDNTAAFKFPTLSANTGIGYDEAQPVQGIPEGGSGFQGQNVFMNGTVPDYVAAGSSKTVGGNVAGGAALYPPQAIVFKNPS